MSGEPSPEDVVLQDEDRLSVAGLLAHLTPDQRQIVELRLAGLNGNEIAEVLGRSRGSVDTAQSRAITRLRAVFAHERANGMESEARHVSA
jgi:RNA polymerase sigma-70 factor (ECF subfamily)